VLVLCLKQLYQHAGFANCLYDAFSFADGSSTRCMLFPLMLQHAGSLGR
jgi:hypothetical protein